MAELFKSGWEMYGLQLDGEYKKKPNKWLDIRSSRVWAAAEEDDSHNGILEARGEENPIIVAENDQID